MFNQETKERFLSNYINSTSKHYNFILKKAEPTEVLLNKDIYEFSPYECDQLIYSYSRRSELMVSVLISVFKNYVDFCIKNNLKKDIFNYFATIKGMEGVRKYVDKTAIESKYINYEQLIEIEELCQNPQDAICAVLPFFGVKGQQAEEILNLKKTDLVEPNIIKLSDRDIIVPFREFELIKDAINQNEYLKGNGEPSKEAKSTVMYMFPSEYVLKTAGKDKIGKLNYQSLLMRIYRIKNYFDNPYITINNLWVSGQIHQIKKIKEEKGVIEKEDYQKVNKMFGYSDVYWYQSKTRIERYI